MSEHAAERDAHDDAPDDGFYPHPAGCACPVSEESPKSILVELGDWAAALQATPAGTMVSSEGAGRDLAVHVTRLAAGIEPCCQKYRGWHSATCRVIPPAMGAES